ncbi:MAG: GNAT family N-acetyltransferase [Firmicutes bacterium]|nr:GNAT family N-acetyltransferase [Bacillota bacterium]
MFVRLDCIGRGLGRRLLAYLQDRCDRLELRVYLQNERALRCYLAAGFAEKMTVSDDATGRQELVMVWEKTQPA